MITRVSSDNGLWNDLTLQWEQQCNQFEENFAEYALASMPVVETLAVGTQRADAGIFAFKEGDEYLAVCQINSTLLPKYTGKVLRVRHIILAPKYDFGRTEIDDYKNVLVSVFVGALSTAEHEMPSEHIKFHLRSPLELTFGQAFTDVMSEHQIFTQCDMRGSWIYISKT